MRYFALNFVLIHVCLSGAVSASAETACQYAGEPFSVGSTRCECPTLKMEAGYLADTGAKIISRTLVCGEDGRWSDGNSLCLDINYTKNSWTPDKAQADFIEYTDLYCHRLAVNHAEIEEAITQDTGDFFGKTSKSVALVAVHAICIRYKINALCSPVIDALARGSDNTGPR